MRANGLVPSLLRKVRITPSIVFSLVMLGLFAYIVTSAAGYRPQARLFPWAIGIPALALMVLQIIIDQVRARRPVRAEDTGGMMDLPVDPNTPPAVVVRRSSVAFGWVFGLFFGIWLFGFLVAIPVFVLAYMLVMAKSRWYEALAFVAAILVLVIGVFHFILAMPWLRPVFPGLQELIISLIGG